MYLPLFSYLDWTTLLVRFVFGLIFLAHGWPKIKNLKMTSQNFEMMGFRPGSFWGLLVAFVEFLGGLCILFGFYTQLAALFLAIDMSVATLWKIKRGQGLAGGYELELMLFTVGLLLVSLGAGSYSLDSYSIRFY